MKITVNIPKDLLDRAFEYSGTRTASAAVRWAINEAIQRHAVDELLSRRQIIDFAIYPEELESAEIANQYKNRSKRGRLKSS
jgi:hypothetical protein